MRDTLAPGSFGRKKIAAGRGGAYFQVFAGCECASAQLSAEIAVWALFYLCVQAILHCLDRADQNLQVSDPVNTEITRTPAITFGLFSTTTWFKFYLFEFMSARMSTATGAALEISFTSAAFTFGELYCRAVRMLIRVQNFICPADADDSCSSD